MSAALTEALVLVASALAVAMLVGIAALLGFRVRGRFVDEAAARAAFAAYDARIEMSEIVVQGGWAIARLTDGRWALARAMGDGAAVRILSRDAPRPALRAAKDGVVVRIPDLDVGFPGGVLRLPQAPAWLDALARGD